VINHHATTLRHKSSLIPSPVIRIGNAQSEITDAALLDKAVASLEQAGGFIHPSLELGNLYRDHQLRASENRSDGLKIKPANPSWFSERLTNDWGFVATDNIEKGSILARIPGHLIIRTDGILPLKDNIDFDLVRAKVEGDMDVIRLVQAALHLIGDSKKIFKEKEEQQEWDVRGAGWGNNNKRTGNNINQNQKRLTDYYFKEVISQALYLLFLKSNKAILSTTNFLNIYPDSYPLLDLINDPNSQYLDSNQENCSPWTVHSYTNDFWLPSLESITLGDIPPDFFEILNSSLQTVSPHPSKTTLLELLFFQFKTQLNLVHPGSLQHHLNWAITTAHRYMLQKLPQDPNRLKPLTNEWLYAPSTNGIVPFVELFRETEQPNCEAIGAYYFEKDADEGDESDDVVVEDEIFLDSGDNDTENGQNKPNGQKITQITRLRRIEYEPEENLQNINLKQHLDSIGVIPTKYGVLTAPNSEQNYGQDNNDQKNNQQNDGRVRSKYFRNTNQYNSPEYRISDEKAQSNTDPANVELPYENFYYEIKAQRDILRGEELTICSYPLRELGIPILTPQTEEKLQRLLQNTNRLKDLLRYSLVRVPEIVQNYSQQTFINLTYPGEFTTSCGTLPALSLKSKIMLLNPTHGFITREITPSYYYLSEKSKKQSFFPTDFKFRTFGKLIDYDVQQMGPITSIDQLTPRDRKLVRYSEDSFPYLNWDDAPLKYIVPSYYDDFDLFLLFQNNKRWNEIYQAFSDPSNKNSQLNIRPGPDDGGDGDDDGDGGDNNTNAIFAGGRGKKIDVVGKNKHLRKKMLEQSKQSDQNNQKKPAQEFVDKYQQFEISWLGPLHPNLEAFYRFYMSPGFYAPHPDKLPGFILKEFEQKYGGKNHHNNSNNHSNTHSNNHSNTHSNIPITDKMSYEFVLKQFQIRFDYVCDAAERNIRSVYNIPDRNPLTAQQWIEAFSEKIDEENEMCKFIGLYQSSVRLGEKFSHRQNFRQLINSYDEVVVRNGNDDDDGIDGFEKNNHFSVPKNQYFDSDFYFDSHLSIQAKYNQSALISHLCKVFAGRLGLDRHHLLSHDQVSRILHNNIDSFETSLNSIYEERIDSKNHRKHLSSNNPKSNSDILPHLNPNNLHTQPISPFFSNMSVNNPQPVQYLYQNPHNNYDHNNTAANQHILADIDNIRDVFNGGLAIPPRWHCLDGMSYDVFNQYYQRNNRSSINRYAKIDYLDRNAPFQSLGAGDQKDHEEVIGKAIPRYRPYIPK
jgi:hypothetical protein